MALLLVPIIGAMALGGEVSSWFFQHRQQQNTADSAVLAAAQKGASGYTSEARAVATRYGYPNGGDITVTPEAIAEADCPDVPNLVAGFGCYKVTVTHVVPVYLSGAVGFAGDTTLVSGGAGKTITAYAIAGTVSSSRTYCLIGLDGITVNGGGDKPDFKDCDFLSGGDMRCDGTNSDGGVVFGDAFGTNGTGGGTNTCGDNPRSGVPFGGDPYETTVTGNIDDMSGATCVAGGTITSLSAGVNCFIGNVTLGSDITISNPETVIMIRNGGLDLGNHKLSTAQDASVTIVYTCATSGCSGAQPGSAVLSSNGGILDISAPTGDVPWKGYLFVEDPRLSGANIGGGQNSLDVAFNGSGQSSVTFKVTGLFYLPNGDFDVGGAINHATNSDYGAFTGLNCLSILAEHILLAGTVALFDNPTKDCKVAGTDDAPTVPLVALLR